MSIHEHGLCPTLKYGPSRHASELNHEDEGAQPSGRPRHIPIPRTLGCFENRAAQLLLLLKSSRKIRGDGLTA